MLRPITLTCAAAFGGVAFAQGPDVAIVAAATSSSTDCRFTDPQSLLMATGSFSSVSIFNANTGTPTLQDLMQYDAVITWSNSAYADSVALGNVLADYVDAGGGVVVAVFANAITGAASRLQGR